MSVANCPKLNDELALLEELCSKRDLRGAAAKVRELESNRRNEVFASPRFLLSKAVLMNQTGDYRSAIDAASSAYELVRETSDHELLAQIQTERARAHHYLGDTDFGEREYRDVAASFRRAGNTAGVIDTLNRIAGIRYLRADYREATRLLEEAEVYAKEMADEQRLARINGNIGRIAIREGRFQDAVDRLSTSLDIQTRLGNHVSLSRSLLSLALVEIRLGNFDSARRNLKKALKLIREHDLRRELAIYFEYKAELHYLLGNFDKALNAVGSSIEIGCAVAPDGDHISQSERLKGLILFRMRRLDEAEAAANKALHVAERIDERLEIAESLKLLAEISDKRDRHTDSRQQLEYAIALLRELNVTYELADCYERAAKLSWVDESTRVYYRHMATELLESIGLEVELRRQSGDSNLQDPIQHMFVVAGANGDVIRIVTSDRQMRSVLKIADHCKDSDIPIMITGETGTGKDLLASYIHYSSNRSTGPFISVNCSAIPKDLAESELFGHVKGSFTNAVDNKEGLISAANGGTLFLNEIGELPLALQAKLLGCLEEKRVVRIGDTVASPVDFRLISATNRDVEEDIAEGKFRQDLYFRIAVMTLELPPLRQRGKDVLELIRLFMLENGVDVSGVEGLLKGDNVHSILRYPWPGNVRELRNEIQLLSLQCAKDAPAIIEALCEKLAGPNEFVDYDSISGLSDQLAAFEQDRIKRALESTGGVIRRAAALLRIPEATLRSKMRRHEM